MTEIVKIPVDNTTINLLNDFEQIDMRLGRGNTIRFGGREMAA